MVSTMQRPLADAGVQGRVAPIPAGDGQPAIGIPEADPTFWVDTSVGKFLRAVEDRSATGEVVNVLLLGPTGIGKSSLPKEFAASRRRPFFAMHCQLVTEPGDWWGTKELSPDRGTFFRKAALLEAIATPGCVILLDEANRTPPENLNALFGLLDHRRQAWVPELHEHVQVAPGVVFFITLNEGADYYGTNPVDRALRDRICNTVRMDHPPKGVESNLLVQRTGIPEEAASRLVDFAQMVRHNAKLGIEVSTRQLLESAALVKAGLDFQDAVLFSIVNGSRSDLDRKGLLQALQVSGGVAAAETRAWEDDE